MILCSKSMTEKKIKLQQQYSYHIIIYAGVGKEPRETGLMTNIPDLKHKHKHDLDA